MSLSSTWRDLSRSKKLASGSAVIVAILFIGSVGNAGAPGGTPAQDEDRSPAAVTTATIPEPTPRIAPTPTPAPDTPSPPTATPLPPATTPTLQPATPKPSVAPVSFGTDVDAAASRAPLVDSRDWVEAGQEIAWRLELPPVDGTQLIRVTVTDAVVGRTLIDESFSVEPGSSIFYGKTVLADEPGAYLLRYYVGASLLGEGSFTVREPAVSVVTPAPATPKPSATPKAESLTIKATSLTERVKPGAKASVTIKTVPNARCSIQVVYKSGPSKAQGLDRKTADSSGKVSWTWTVGTNTTPGTWPINISCSAGSTSDSLKLSFTVYK